MKNISITGLISAIAIVVVVISAGCIGEVPQPAPTPDPPLETASAFVYRVIDGDTVVLRDDERVRLIGIDAPEKGQPDSEAATRRLKDLIEGRYVTLEKDVEDKDRFGRLLRYIYVNDTFVNLEMVREGYASVFIIYPNIRYSSEFEDAMQKEI